MLHCATCSNVVWHCMHRKEFVKKFLLYLIPLLIFGIVYAHFKSLDEEITTRLILLMSVFSFIIAYWEEVYLPNSRGRTIRKHLNKLETLGFCFVKNEYHGLFNNYPISIAYFRNDHTKLPNIRIIALNEIHQNQLDFQSLSYESNNYFDKSDSAQLEFEVSDMRTIFDETINEIKFITAEFIELNEKTKS